jgi:hypothetical protein
MSLGSIVTNLRDDKMDKPETTAEFMRVLKYKSGSKKCGSVCPFCKKMQLVFLMPNSSAVGGCEHIEKIEGMGDAVRVHWKKTPKPKRNKKIENEQSLFSEVSHENQA